MRPAPPGGGVAGSRGGEASAVSLVRVIAATRLPAPSPGQTSGHDGARPRAGRAIGRQHGVDLAYAAGRQGGSAPAWLSAANEVAVEAFLRGGLRWTAIAEVVAETLEGWRDDQVDQVDAVLAADAAARARATAIVTRRLSS